MALPSTGWYPDFTVATPSAAVTDFTILVDLANMPAAWWADVNTTDGTRGRASNPAGSVEYAVDWIEFDNVAETGIARVLVPGTHGTLTGVSVRLYPPNTRNAAVAAGATYGQFAAYLSTLKGYWPKGGGNDRTINANHGTANGGVTVGGVAGQIGRATDFDGTDDYISWANDAALQRHAEISVFAWVQQGTNRTHYIISKQSGNADTTVEYKLEKASNRLYFVLGDGSTSANAWVSLSDTSPHYVGGVSDGSQLTAYVDTTASTPTTAAYGADARTSELNVGDGINNVFATPWDGLINELSLHSTALSPAWIAHEYAQANDNAAFLGTVTAGELGGGGGPVAQMNYYRRMRA